MSRVRRAGCEQRQQLRVLSGDAGHGRLPLLFRPAVRERQLLPALRDGAEPHRAGRRDPYALPGVREGDDLGTHRRCGPARMRRLP